MSKRDWVSALAGAALGLLTPDRAAAGTTRYFEHRDERYLLQGQRQGGAVLLPDRVPPGEALPLVVFLHGTNSIAQPHLWFGGGGRDLRPLANRLVNDGTVQPFVLAAPSQTRAATLARGLWAEFDLGAFVDDVVEATKGSLQIDRDQILLVGHSGAGCNPEGGLAQHLGPNAEQVLLAIVSIDPCLDAEMGATFAERPSGIPLLVWWQSAIWHRSPDAFWSALSANRPPDRIDRMLRIPAAGSNPHDAIVPLAFERMAREFLPARPRASSPDDSAQR